MTNILQFQTIDTVLTFQQKWLCENLASFHKFIKNKTLSANLQEIWQYWFLNILLP